MLVGAQLARAVAARVIADDGGQDLIEYALLTAIVSIAGVLFFSTFSTTMGTRYSARNAAAQNAWQPPSP
jgi:Flp pilus assembly pilin Flp